MRCRLTSAPSCPSRPAGRVGRERASASGEHGSDDGRRLEHRPLLPRQQVEARREQRVIVGGISSSVGRRRDPAPFSRRRRPSSMSIESICSAKSGLPAAAATTRRAPAGSGPPASTSRTTPISSSRRQRHERIARGRRSVLRQLGSAARRRRRGSARSCRGDDVAQRSRNVRSAQCRSSTMATTGRAAARPSSSLRAPQNSSSTGKARPRGRPPRPRGLDAVVAAGQAAQALGLELRRVGLRMPEASCTSSRSGQNVMRARRRGSGRAGRGPAGAGARAPRRGASCPSRRRRARFGAAGPAVSRRRAPRAGRRARPRGRRAGRRPRHVALGLTPSAVRADRSRLALELERLQPLGLDRRRDEPMGRRPARRGRARPARAGRRR